MDDEQIKNQESELTPEELKSEEEALTDVKEEEVKSKIAEDLGINPEYEPELFEKLLKRELSQRERLSGAIKQKISWREKATKKINPKDTPKDGESPAGGPEVFSEELLEKKLNEREAKRDLENLDLPEEVETEIKDLSKIKGISIREAAKHPYILSKIEEVKRGERIKLATPRRTGRSSYSLDTYDPSQPLDPNDFKLDTKKGQKAWAQAKAARRRHEQENLK